MKNVDAKHYFSRQIDHPVYANRMYKEFFFFSRKFILVGREHVVLIVCGDMPDNGLKCCDI